MDRIFPDLPVSLPISIAIMPHARVSLGTALARCLLSSRRSLVNKILS